MNRVRVRSTLHDERINDAFSRFEQVERNLDELEGRVEAYDVGRTKTLTEEIAELEADKKVQDELAALKARVAARRDGLSFSRAEGRSLPAGEAGHAPVSCPRRVSPACIPACGPFRPAFATPKTPQSIRKADP